MWPFSKINKLETELEWVRYELQRMNEYSAVNGDKSNQRLNNIITTLHMQNDSAELRYNNMCRLLDILVLESRANHKEIMDILKKESLLS